MHIKRAAFGYFATFLGSVVGPVVLYRISIGLSLWTLAACVLAFGLGLGLTTGLVGRIAALPVAYAAFGAVGLLWMPVLLVSLGAAFIAIPVLPFYAALVGVGANVSGRLYRGKVSVL